MKFIMNIAKTKRTSVIRKTVVLAAALVLTLSGLEAMAQQTPDRGRQSGSSQSQNGYNSNPNITNGSGNAMSHSSSWTKQKLEDLFVHPAGSPTDIRFMSYKQWDDFLRGKMNYELFHTDSYHIFHQFDNTVYIDGVAFKFSRFSFYKDGKGLQVVYESTNSGSASNANRDAEKILDLFLSKGCTKTTWGSGPAAKMTLSDGTSQTIWIKPSGDYVDMGVVFNTDINPSASSNYNNSGNSGKAYVSGGTYYATANTFSELQDLFYKPGGLPKRVTSYSADQLEREYKKMGITCTRHNDIVSPEVRVTVKGIQFKLWFVSASSTSCQVHYKPIAGLSSNDDQILSIFRNAGFVTTTWPGTDTVGAFFISGNSGSKFFLERDSSDVDLGCFISK